MGRKKGSKVKCKFWTEEEKQKLVALYKPNILNVVQIAAHFPYRTYKSVHYKIQRMCENGEMYYELRS